MKIVRNVTLEPTWNTLKATEPGYMRWMTTHVAGGPGFYNSNPEQAVISDKVIVGMMGMPVAQRQYGLHSHTISEVYVVLKGEITSKDGNGNIHRAGPLDCVIHPAGCYHSFRNSGQEEAVILWIHDRQETEGSSQYIEDRHQPCPPVKLVKYNELMPYWESHKAKEIGNSRFLVNWIGSAEGIDFNPEHSGKSEHIVFGSMGILPYNKQPRHRNGTGVVYFIAQGSVAVSGADGKEEVVGPYDCIYVPAGEPHGLRNIAGETAYVIWLHEEAAGNKIEWEQ